MKFCKKCLQPDTRPRIEFHESGVCMACIMAEEMKKVNWEEREVQLKRIAEWAKQNNQGRHDCIIGISGGKDSTLQALYARDKLGLNPLLVNLHPGDITPWGAANFENLIRKGFDALIYRPNPDVWRKTIKHAFFEYLNPVKPTEYPLFAVSYITAVKFGIPLIIQGENDGLTLGTVDEMGTDDNALNVRYSNTLAGGKASDWFVDGMEMKDLLFYEFPAEEEFEKADIRAIWLNYYAKEWGFSNNTQFGFLHGVSPRPDHDPLKTGRINPYGSIDSDMQILNQMLKYYKFGFGVVTDEVGYYIREGRMSLEDARIHIQKYDGKCDDKYVHDFCDFIEISVEEFWQTVDKFVNRKLFYKDDNGKWQPKFIVGVDFDEDK
jgi:N-acetyl sugar amidotransferase